MFYRRHLGQYNCHFKEAMLADSKIGNAFSRLKDVFHKPAFSQMVLGEDQGLTFIDLWRKIVPESQKHNLRRARMLEKAMKYMLTYQSFENYEDYILRVR